MEHQDERRRWPRADSMPPDVCILYYGNSDSKFQSVIENPSDSLFVDLFNKTHGGALLKTSRKFEIDTVIHLQVYGSDSKSWEFFPAIIKCIKPINDKIDNFFIGVEFLRHVRIKMPIEPDESEIKHKPSASDYDFFRQVNILKLINRDAVCPILNTVFHQRIKAGERFIHQEDQGDAFYVIQKGTCCVNVEKEGQLHRLARRRENDIIGEMAILTGEPRSAHVDAETDMVLWGLTTADFEKISNEHPELRSFMTEIVAERFASSKLTAERNIGKYLITDIIGRGGYSIVYKGIYTSLNMPVAIKMLFHDMAMDPDFFNTFKEEAQTIAQFDHENIIRVYDIEEIYRTIFIIMELMEGESLSNMVKRLGSIPPSCAVDYLLQICAGLDYAHQQNVIHRDIKSDNIIVQPDDRLKILDFGLACPHRF